LLLVPDGLSVEMSIRPPVCDHEVPFQGFGLEITKATEGGTPKTTVIEEEWPQLNEDGLALRQIRLPGPGSYTFRVRAINTWGKGEFTPEVHLLIGVYPCGFIHSGFGFYTLRWCDSL
jgi:hypothetical protein